MLRSLLGIPVLCIALAVELVLAAQLLTDLGLSISWEMWLIAHTAASVLAAICMSSMVRNLVPGKRLPLILLFASFSLFMPFVGIIGTWFSVTFGAILANGRHKENVFWQVTSNADLPFAAPIDRPIPKLDSRGFVEQLAFDTQTDKLYNKVAAAKHIRNSQSAPVLKSAVGHSNERIRLVAYQLLDKKVNNLNREIQRLESDARVSEGTGKSNIHLQIANNYWELLTLEEDEPVAREELLNKAASQAAQSLAIEPRNVNAHFTLGQIYLKQGEHEKATDAFLRSIELGISPDKALPYIAEAAYVSRNFNKLRDTLANVSPAFRAYPPMSNVVEYWA